MLMGAVLMQVAEVEAAAAARQREAAARIAELTSKLEAAESSTAGGSAAPGVDVVDTTAAYCAAFCEWSCNVRRAWQVVRQQGGLVHFVGAAGSAFLVKSSLASSVLSWQTNQGYSVLCGAVPCVLCCVCCCRVVGAAAACAEPEPAGGDCCTQ